MPKVDNIVNVKDDSLIHRELVELDSPHISMKEYRDCAVLVQELHQNRLIEYAKKRQIGIDVATSEIMRLHSEGINVASHISYVIGVKHADYMRQLTDLHENPWFIR